MNQGPGFGLALLRGIMLFVMENLDLAKQSIESFLEDFKQGKIERERLKSLGDHLESLGQNLSQVAATLDDNLQFDKPSESEEETRKKGSEYLHRIK